MNKEIYELTNPQKSIWLTEQFYNGSPVNNICGTVVIDQVVNFEILKQATYQFIKDNDSFRIKLFYNDKGEIVQEITDFEPFDIQITDVKNEEDLTALENQMVNKPFSTLNSCLHRFRMFRLPNGKGGLVVVGHHLICDACTASLVANKIINIYTSLLKGEAISDVPTSYINYINSEKDYLVSNKFEKDREYWNSVFKTVPEIGNIPSMKQENKNTCSAERKTFILSKEQVQKINTYCTENKISIFNFFMALYAVYVCKVTGLDDFVLGTPILNRSTFVEKNTPGMFISTVPFRFTISDGLSFIDFAKKIAFDSLGMFRHQKYPYQNILEDVRKVNPSQPNLYDILISYQNTKTNRNDSEVPYEVRWTFNNNVADSMQIHLFDVNDEGLLNISYDYRLDKYDEEDIYAIHDRICHIIKQILKNNNLLIESIDIVTPKERNILLKDFNNTSLKYNKNKTVVDYFEEQVKKTPDNIALVFEKRILTYKQLNDKVNSLARYLRQNGIKNNYIVGIMLNRSFEMIVSILAVLKAGGAYIPIDPEYPEERISYMLENSNSPILLSQKHLSDKINNINFKGNIIFTDFSNNEIYSLDNSNVENISKSDDLSYIIYTSGSTGNPKGVMLTHKNLSNFIASMFDKICYLKDDIAHSIVSITTVSFDIFVFETLISLCKGLKLFITNEIEQKMTLKLERLILDNNIEIIQSTPSIMSFHLENLSMNAFSKLKYVMLAGEQLPKSLVDRIKSISPECIVYNGYGPSETTIFSTVKDVTNLENISIGEPIANTQIYILNKDFSLLPQNTVGEIYIAGDGVGVGYLNREDLTAERYLPNPFEDNSIMYKTGDLGIWLCDGSIECKGRADHQVKLRGLRIELGEIEECINNFNKLYNIKSAVIVKGENSKASLNAFISSNVDFDITELKEYLSSKLPIYMIPNTYTILDALPFTPNGKIDRKVLRNYEINDEVIDFSYTSPRNELEEIIVNSIKKKLSLNDFGIDNNIFNYGADSLTIINILTDLFQHNINLKVYDFYENPTVRELYDNLLANNDTQNSLTLNEEKLFALNNIVKDFSTSIESTVDNSSKSVLLTGVTGFLGVHILADLLDNKEKIKKIYCCVRRKDDRSIEQRLLDQLHFYFGTKYDNLLNGYVECINSNISEEMLAIDNSLLNNLKGTIDCVIHAAANVKHYGNYSESEKANIQGTQHIINFCKYVNAPLHYISTMTVSGNYLLEQEHKDMIFDENTFYKKQSFNDNVYTKSKLIAETLVIHAIKNGLDATIYRVGDLTGRYSDGVFQKNIEDNSIYLRLKSLLEIGLIPDTILNNTLEFTPVEYAAKAISTIIWSTQNKNRIYHIYNPNMLKTSSLLHYLDNMNINMKISSIDNFLDIIKKLSSNIEDQSKLTGIINDFTKENDLIYNHIITTKNDITCKYLSNLGFLWPILDFEYVKKLIEYMISVDFLKIK